MRFPLCPPYRAPAPKRILDPAHTIANPPCQPRRLRLVRRDAFGRRLGFSGKMFSPDLIGKDPAGSYCREYQLWEAQGAVASHHELTAMLEKAVLSEWRVIGTQLLKRWGG